MAAIAGDGNGKWEYRLRDGARGVSWSSERVYVPATLGQSKADCFYVNVVAAHDGRGGAAAWPGLNQGISHRKSLVRKVGGSGKPYN